MGTFINKEISGCGSIIGTPTGMQIALSNSLVLDKIFNFLRSPKVLRLVCKIWNEIFLSGKPRLILKLGSVPYDGENEAERNIKLKDSMETLDSRLLNHISLNIYKFLRNGFWDWDTQNLYQCPFKLFQICEAVGTNIQKISVTWNVEIFLPLYEILCSNYCPSIRTLGINFRSPKKSPQVKADFGRLPKLPTIPTLNSLRLAWSCEVYNQNTNHSFVIDLLAATPKLENISINACCCPSLGFHQELKKFKFYSEEKKCKHLFMTDISTVLEEVKDSLKILNLSGSNDIIAQSLKIPPMPRLVVYINTLGNGVFATNMAVFGSASMPFLTDLEISLYNMHLIREDEKNLEFVMQLRNEGIKILILNGLRENMTEGLPQLKTPFPHLRKLDLYLQPEWEKDEEDEYEKGIRFSTWVGNIIVSCSRLQLHHLRIEIQFKYSMTEMVKLFWGCRVELFSGLKVLELISRNCCEDGNKAIDDLQKDGEKKFREILIMTKNMQRVVLEGFLLRGGHAKRLFEFISDNKLPVLFFD